MKGVKNMEQAWQRKFMKRITRKGTLINKST